MNIRVFLSHSSKDHEFVEKVAQLIGQLISVVVENVKRLLIEPI